MDSPALNPHSRAVLIPLTPVQLPPTAVQVPGPGPVESHAKNETSEAPDADAEDNGETAPPPPPVAKTELEGEQEVDLESDQEEDAPARKRTAGSDPYSNLDGAFGNYLADEPRPMGTNSAGRNEVDDLLF